MMKRIWGLVLVFCMLMSFAPYVQAATIVDRGFCGEHGDNLVWVLDSDGTLTISGEGNMERFQNNTPWSSYNWQIRKVIINQGVTSIGDSAFSSTNVSSVEIASSVKTIYDSFKYCDSLRSITIPEGVEKLVGYVFNGCHNLNNISLPDSLKYIDCYMCKNTALFDNPDNWEDGVLYISNHLICADDTGEYTISENYTVKQGTITLAIEAFSMCEDIKSVNLPNSVRYIDNRVFYSCTNLEQINFPDSIESVGIDVLKGTSLYKDKNNWESGALYVGNHLINTQGLSGEYGIKNGTISIAGGACLGSDVSGINIPYGVKNIGSSAFEDCTNLNSIEIPNSVETIGSRAFNCCRALKEISLPESIKNIDEETFAYSGLETITLPDSVISIDDYAFESCYSLTDIYFSDSLEYIGDSAFGSCYNLTGVILPDKTMQIGDCAFEYCESLAYVYVPSSMTFIGKQAFSCRSGELYIEVSSDNNYYCDIDGVLFTKDKTKLLAFGQSSVYPNYTIPNGVNTIGYSAFREERNLKSITIPNGVTVIEDDVFDNCIGLTKLVLPKNLTYIGDSAFFGLGIKDINIPESVNHIGNNAFGACSSITNIVIPSGIKEIGYWTFSGCMNLKSVTIPNSVVSIGNRAFDSCNSLADVYYSGNEEQWKNIEIDMGNDILLTANIHYGKDAIDDLIEPIPLTTISVQKAVNDNKWQFDVTVDKTYEDSYVYVALYDEKNSLTAINRVALNLEESTVIEANKATSDKIARIYVWTKNMQPITEAKNIDL